MALFQEKDSVLIVEGEKPALKNLERAMKKEGYEVTGTTSGANALKLLGQRRFDLVLADLNMKKADGMEVLDRVKSLYPDSEVILITAHATVPSAVEVMKKGAYHYVSRPFKLEEIKQHVRQALLKVRLKKENVALREHLEQFEGKVKIITQDPAMLGLLDTARRVAPTDCNIVITGESGTRKELLARYIHFHSARAGGAFFAVNCAAFTGELLSDELFGHEEGVFFSGAHAVKKGLIEMSSGGTLFLDEVTGMPPAVQVKLLRATQEGEVLRAGGASPVRVDVRLIAAANRDIQEEIKSGRFRQDLYFRLNVVTLRVAPLSSRREDIPLLAHYFLKRYSDLMQKDVTEISPEVFELLMGYDFPGNERELENIVERGVALTNSGRIEAAHLPGNLKALSIRTFRKKDGLIPSLEAQEMNYIKWVLKEVGGNKTLAARTLGIDRVSLWRKLKKAGLEQ